MCCVCNVFKYCLSSLWSVTDQYSTLRLQNPIIAAKMMIPAGVKTLSTPLFPNMLAGNIG